MTLSSNMDLSSLPLPLPILFLTLAVLVLCLYLHKQKPSKLPPGPNPLPILGNILQLGSKPHKSLAKLSQIHGPLMLLRLGFTKSVVVSSPQMAKMVLLKHDHICCTRSAPDAITALDHNLFSVAWMPVDNQWRRIRTLCREKMFSTHRLDASHGLRVEKLNDLCDYVRRCSAAAQPVDIGKAAFTTSLNLMSASLFSLDAAALGTDSSQQFRDIIGGIMALVGKPNLTDYFPILKVVDPQGIFRKCTQYMKKCFNLFDEIIEKRKDEMPKNDMLQELLDFNQRSDTALSLDYMKHLLLDLFVAGADTTSGTVEWAMAELIRNPEKMLKAQKELKNILGEDEIQESYISRLAYLRGVVKETFRLHPTVPLLLPRMANEDVEINGYIIPKGTRILVNAWAIGRDPNTWQNPEMFMPERFLEVDTDIHGRHFELIPFGSGRRTCLGLPLAHRMIHMMLATLISNFNWKLDQAHLDMDDKFGLSLQKATPLTALPLPLPLPLQL